MKKQEASSHYRQLPQTPSVLRGKGIVIPQLDPVEGVLLALSNAQREHGGWKVVNAIPTYTHERPTSTTEVTVRPQDAHVVTGDITGQLWQQVRQFNDVDGDIFLALLAQFLGTPPDMHDGAGVWITTQQILEYRGIQPKMNKKERTKAGESTHRRTGHRLEDMQEIAEGMFRIRDTHITVRSWKESHRKRTTTRPTRKRVFQQESYLITVSTSSSNLSFLLKETKFLILVPIQVLLSLGTISQDHALKHFLRAPIIELLGYSNKRSNTILIISNGKKGLRAILLSKCA